MLRFEESFRLLLTVGNEIFMNGVVYKMEAS